MSDPRLTRRSALALGAAGAGALVTAGPAFAVSPGNARGAITTVPVTGAMRLRVRQPFVLVGLRGPGLSAARAQLRVRRSSGAWGPWTAVQPGRHRPDGASAPRSSEPVITGPATELELVLRGPLRGRHELVLVGGAVPPRTARAAQLPAGPAILPRSAWGAAAVPPRGSAAYGTVQLAFVHHTEGGNGYAQRDVPAIIQAIARYHISSNGWNDIGYNFVVDSFGGIWEGRAGGIDRAVVGAQAGGWNSVSTGVAILGSFTQMAAPSAALDAVAALLAWKLPLHGAPVAGTLTLVSAGGRYNRYPAGQSVTFQRISGHRDGCSTDCPGDTLYGQLGDLRLRALARAGLAVGPVPEAIGAVALDAAPAAVTFGDELALAGLVTGTDGVPAAGRGVSIQKRGSSRWVTVATAVTGMDGRFSAALLWKRGGTVRAAVAGPGATVASPQADVLLAPRLEAWVAGPRVKAGARARIAGTVQGASAVTIVVERLYRDGRWRRIAAVRADAAPTGRFRALVTLRQPGLHRFTVRAGDGAATVRSPRLFVRAVRGR